VLPNQGLNQVVRLFVISGKQHLDATDMVFRRQVSGPILGIEDNRSGCESAGFEVIEQQLQQPFARAGQFARSGTTGHGTGGEQDVVSVDEKLHEWRHGDGEESTTAPSPVSVPISRRAGYDVEAAAAFVSRLAIRGLPWPRTIGLW
jgi:hypothetical protein